MSGKLLAEPFRGQNESYITDAMPLAEAVKLWDISADILEMLCLSDEIEGAKNNHGQWEIPRNTQKPIPKWLRIECSSEVLIGVKNLRVFPGKNFFWVFRFNVILNKKVVENFPRLMEINNEEGNTLVCDSEISIVNGAHIIKIRPRDKYRNNVFYQLRYPTFIKVSVVPDGAKSVLKHLPILFGCVLLRFIMSVLVEYAGDRLPKMFSSYINNRFRTVVFKLEDDHVQKNSVVITRGYEYEAPITSLEPIRESVNPHMNTPIGHIIVPKGLKELTIQMKHLEKEKCDHFPDINIVAPNGDEFGFNCKFLSGELRCSTKSAKSCELGKYTGYKSANEEMTFVSPVHGNWHLSARNIGNGRDAFLEFSSNLPIQPVRKNEPGCEILGSE